ncbi:hypothetical protein GCM10027049_12900 [Mucilaginibacter puniceus]
MGSNVPDGIIEPDEMTNLMVDVHLVDGSIQYIDFQEPDSLYKYGIKRYDNVFKQHHTDSLQFKKSLEYYSLHTKQLEEMYAEVTQILQAKNDSLNKIDSLNRIKKIPTRPGRNVVPKK